MNEHEVRAKVVDIMRSWVGAKEGGAVHHAIIDAYNTITPLPRGYRMSYTDAWCAATVSAAGHLAGYDDIMPAECSCGRMIELYRALGRWEESDAYVPEEGDLIMYDWDDSGSGDNTGAPEHVGMVETVENGKITVIEGNASDMVKRRTLAVNGRYIRGYCLPDYASKATPEAAPEPVYREPRYNTMAEIESLVGFAAPTVRKLIDKGVLVGNGAVDANGDPTELDLTRDMLRILVILDRENIFG